MEIKKINVLSVGKSLGATAFLIGLVTSVSQAITGQEVIAAGRILNPVEIILAGSIGIAIIWALFGMIFALVYNFVVKYTGGIVIE